MNSANQAIPPALLIISTYLFNVFVLATMLGWEHGSFCFLVKLKRTAFKSEAELGMELDLWSVA